MLIDSRRWPVQVLGDFAFWDYNDPLNLPLPLQHSFKVLIADPPYLVGINCRLANQCKILQTVDKCTKNVWLVATRLEQYNICIFIQLFMWRERLQLLIFHKMGWGVYRRMTIYLYNYKCGPHKHSSQSSLWLSTHFHRLDCFRRVQKLQPVHHQHIVKQLHRVFLSFAPSLVTLKSLLIAESPLGHRLRSFSICRAPSA